MTLKNDTSGSSHGDRREMMNDRWRIVIAFNVVGSVVCGEPRTGVLTIQGFQKNEREVNLIYFPSQSF